MFLRLERAKTLSPLRRETSEKEKEGGEKKGESNARSLLQPITHYLSSSFYPQVGRPCYQKERN